MSSYKNKPQNVLGLTKFFNLYFKILVYLCLTMFVTFLIAEAIDAFGLAAGLFATSG